MSTHSILFFIAVMLATFFLLSAVGVSVFGESRRQRREFEETFGAETSGGRREPELLRRPHLARLSPFERRIESTSELKPLLGLIEGSGSQSRRIACYLRWQLALPSDRSACSGCGVNGGRSSAEAYWVLRCRSRAWDGCVNGVSRKSKRSSRRRSIPSNAASGWKPFRLDIQVSGREHGGADRDRVRDCRSRLELRERSAKCTPRDARPSAVSSFKGLRDSHSRAARDGR